MSEARQLQRRMWFTQCRTSDVTKNVGSTFLLRGLQPRGKDYELIITVKIETRYPVEGYFGNEFREISNDCAVSAT